VHRLSSQRLRWLGWGALVTGFVLVSLYRLSTAVIAEPLMRAFDTSGSGLGTLHAAFFYVYAPLQLVAGVLSDRVGIRRTATVGSVVLAGGGLLFAAADSYLVGLLARVVIGAGGSLLYITTLRFCANWFRPREFATMSGLTTAGSGVGGILAATPFAVAVAALGWRETIAGLAAVGVGIAAVIWLVVRDSPADAGVDPVENVPETTDLTLGMVWANLGEVVRDRTTWLAGFAIFCSNGVNLSVLGLWGVPYLVQTNGLSVTTASTFTLLGSVGLTLGTPAIGFLSDRLERRTAVVLGGSLLYVLALGSLAVLRNPPLVLVAGALFLAGFLTGAYVLGYTVVKERFSAEKSGVAIGAVNAIAFVGPAVVPTVMGTILDAYWTGETIAGARVYTALGYQVAFALTTVVAVISVGCALLLHRT
jgi:sugar phosphate permease